MSVIKKPVPKKSKGFLGGNEEIHSDSDGAAEYV